MSHSFSQSSKEKAVFYNLDVCVIRSDDCIVLEEYLAAPVLLLSSYKILKLCLGQELYYIHLNLMKEIIMHHEF